MTATWGRSRARGASRSNESPSAAASTLAVLLFTRHRVGGGSAERARLCAAGSCRAERSALVTCAPRRKPCGGARVQSGELTCRGHVPHTRPPWATLRRLSSLSSSARALLTRKQPPAGGSSLRALFCYAHLGWKNTQKSRRLGRQPDSGESAPGDNAGQ